MGEATLNVKSENQLPYRCPCCGSCTISEPGTYELCNVCNWEDDPIQFEDPDFAGGANKYSLNEARQIWRADHGSNS